MAETGERFCLFVLVLTRYMKTKIPFFKLTIGSYFNAAVNVVTLWAGS
ncbi:hypothetical protein SAMN05518670_2773 [Paenibacillus sp. OK076]|nr:hypothetical protein SAMN05518670_2773 [Paenibacillus sp. OK076]